MQSRNKNVAINKLILEEIAKTGISMFLGNPSAFHSLNYFTSDQ